MAAFRIRRARAGALPVPLGQVLDSISHAAQVLNLRLEGSNAHGDPVAVVTLPVRRDPREPRMNPETLDVRAGELFVSGTIGKRSPDASPVVPEPLRVPTAQRESAGEDQPRVGAAEKATRQN